MATKQLTLGHTVHQKAGNIVSDMGGEKVMLSIENGKYYNLGAMGGTIWEMIQEEMTVEALRNQLLAEYDVKEAVCTEQVLSFLSTLSEEGLISVKNAVAS